MMNEKKDLLEQIIKEDLEKEAQKIREELEDFDGGSLSAEKKAEMKAKLYKEIGKYEVGKAPDEDTEFSEEIGIPMESIHSVNSAGKVIHKKKRLRVYIALAAALVTALALGVNTFGSREKVLKFMQKAIGDREIERVDSDEENLIIETESEGEAYQAVEDKLGVIPVRIVVKPEGFMFEKAEINSDAQMAEMFYGYEGSSAIYLINAAHGNGSWGIFVEDEIMEEYEKQVKGISVQIKEHWTPETKTRRYSASFTHQNVDYFFMGTMEQDEFENIIDNLHFFM